MIALLLAIGLISFAPRRKEKQTTTTTTTTQTANGRTVSKTPAQNVPPPVQSA